MFHTCISQKSFKYEVPQSLVLWPLLFLIFIEYLPSSVLSFFTSSLEENLRPFRFFSVEEKHDNRKETNLVNKELSK